MADGNTYYGDNTRRVKATRGREGLLNKGSNVAISSLTKNCF